MPAKKIKTIVKTNPITKRDELLHGVFAMMVGGVHFELSVMTIGDELLALDFIDDKDDSGNRIMILGDSLLRRFAVDKNQCRAMGGHEKKIWQQRLQSWQKGATPSLRLIGTDFQQRVWRALFSVGYGKTISYFDLAQKINSHHRAVAKNGVGRNPIGYFIPCHRVIAKNGGLGGYGGGMTTKIKLLQAEKSI